MDMGIITIEYQDLALLLREITSRDSDDIYAIHVQPRTGGVAVKVNGGAWTPTLGHPKEDAG